MGSLTVPMLAFWLRFSLWPMIASARPAAAGPHTATEGCRPRRDLRATTTCGRSPSDCGATRDSDNNSRRSSFYSSSSSPSLTSKPVTCNSNTSLPGSAGNSCSDLGQPSSSRCRCPVETALLPPPACCPPRPPPGFPRATSAVAPAQQTRCLAPPPPPPGFFVHTAALTQQARCQPPRPPPGFLVPAVAPVQQPCCPPRRPPPPPPGFPAHPTAATAAPLVAARPPPPPPGFAAPQYDNTSSSCYHHLQHRRQPHQPQQPQGGLVPQAAIDELLVQYNLPYSEAQPGRDCPDDIYWELYKSFPSRAAHHRRQIMDKISAMLLQVEPGTRVEGFFRTEAPAAEQATYGAVSSSLGGAVATVAAMTPPAFAPTTASSSPVRVAAAVGGSPRAVRRSALTEALRSGGAC